MGLFCPECKWEYSIYTSKISDLKEIIDEESIFYEQSSMEKEKKFQERFKKLLLKYFREKCWQTKYANKYLQKFKT